MFDGCVMDVAWSFFLVVRHNIDFCAVDATAVEGTRGFLLGDRPSHMRFLSALAALGCAHGWWWRGNSSAVPDEGPWRRWLQDTSPFTASWLNQAEEKFESVKASVQEASGFSWDQGLWWVFDMVVGTLGWLIFGTAWGNVQSGIRRLLQLGALFALCVRSCALHLDGLLPNCVFGSWHPDGSGVAVPQTLEDRWHLAVLRSEVDRWSTRSYRCRLSWASYGKNPGNGGPEAVQA